MLDIKDWRDGWSDYEGLIRHLANAIDNYRADHKPRNAISEALFDAIKDDMNDEVKLASAHQTVTSLVSMLRALNAEESLLERWAAGLGQLIPGAPVNKKRIYEGWKDFLEKEVESNRRLHSIITEEVSIDKP